MSKNIYDVGIIGCGVAGTFAALKLLKEHKNINVILFDLGARPLKRRRALEGFLGAFPSGDGKLYMNDLKALEEISTHKKITNGLKLFKQYTKDCFDLNIMKDKGPSISFEKRAKKNGFDVHLNNYVQLYPKDIHNLTKQLASFFEDLPNLTMSFDNEIFNIHKQKGSFLIVSEKGEFNCKKILMSVGRSGWRWAKKIYEDFGMIENNDYARFGVRLEMPANNMKDLNRSNCVLKSKNLEIGPFSWNGTIIPEDHIDLVISSFRSNENRWKTDKVSFNLIGDRYFKNMGQEQSDRVGKLTFVLSNDRVLKEKTSNIINQKSKISIIPEYDWLIDELLKVSKVIPELISKSHFYVPTLIPMIPKIDVASDFSTQVSGMYCAGESAGVSGLLSAAISGLIAADGLAK